LNLSKADDDLGQPVLDEEVREAKVVSLHKELVDGLEFQVPMTDKGKLVLWRCLPNCGKCCFPGSLSVLPKQAEAMKARGAKVLDLPLPMMPQLEEPRDGRRCPWLAEDLTCNAYDDRPHSCRLYPFQYTQDKKRVGYLRSELTRCPGFYLADGVDAGTLESWKAVAAESNKGIAYLNEGVSELMKQAGELIKSRLDQAKNGPSA